MIEHIAKKALWAAADKYRELQFVGKRIVGNNQFGDGAMIMDIELEKAVITKLVNNYLPARIISEEHGIIDLCENPQFLVIIDGLDGSNVYKQNHLSGRFGTMLSIYYGLNPIYDDYVFCGIMELNKYQMVFATKYLGAYTDNPYEQNHIYVNKDNDIVYVDDYWAINRELTKEIDYTCLQSSSMHYTDLASGKCGIVLECTRKQNLEIATAYGLIKEAGGFIRTIEGKDIGNKKYLEFWQGHHLPIVFGTDENKVNQFIKRIR